MSNSQLEAHVAKLCKQFTLAACSSSPSGSRWGTNQNRETSKTATSGPVITGRYTEPAALQRLTAMLYSAMLFYLGPLRLAAL